MPFRYRSSLPVILTLALTGTGCQNAASPGTGGSSHVLLTDDAFPYYRLQRVDLYVVSVSASLGADTGGVGSTGGQFLTIATPARRINLLALQNGMTDELGTVDLPSGAITAVRMVIDTDSSSITLRDGRVLTGGSTPGINWQFSVPRPTLNALVHEQIAVPDTGAVIVIDFDVGTSFILPQEVDPASTDSGFIFAPEFRAVDANRTGSIAGTVRAQSAAGQPVVDASLQLYLGYPQAAENTWWRVGTASATTNGTFRFSFVTRSDWWTTTSLAGVTYFVAADPPPGSGLGRAVVGNVRVDPGQETALGTIVLH